MSAKYIVYHFMGKIKGVFAISQIVNFLVLLVHHTFILDVVKSVIDHSVGMESQTVPYYVFLLLVEI